MSNQSKFGSPAETASANKRSDLAHQFIGDDKGKCKHWFHWIGGNQLCGMKETHSYHFLPEPVSTEGAGSVTKFDGCGGYQNIFGTAAYEDWQKRSAASSIAPVPARDAEERRVERLMDLVRYQRSELLAEKLIDQLEYAALTADSDSGQRVARLEGYDDIRAQLAAAHAVIEEMRVALEELRGLAQRQGWIHVAIQQADRALARADSYRNKEAKR